MEALTLIADQSRRSIAKKANINKVGRLLRVKVELGKTSRKNQKRWLEALYATSLKSS